MATATVTITVTGVSCPWWMCCDPRSGPPDPYPVRPTEFVTLEDYDKDFTYPLASSRAIVPVQQSGCGVACGPNMGGETPPPPEPPEPECEFPSAWNVTQSPDGTAYAITVDGEPITHDNYQDLLLSYNQYSFYITDAGLGQPGIEVMMELQWGDFDPNTGNFLFFLSEDFLDNRFVPFEQWACLRGYRSYGEGWFQDPVGVINCCEEQTLCVELHHQGGSGSNGVIRDFEINGLPDWFVWGDDFEVVYGGQGSGYFVYNNEYNQYENQNPSLYGFLGGTDGTLAQSVHTVCVNWSIPVGH